MKKLIIIAIISILLLPNVVVAQTNKYALIVSYDSQGSSRIFASHCARLLKDVLKDNGFSQKSININTKASYRDLTEGMDWLGAMEDSNSEVVIGFFGHGSGTHIGLKDVALTHSMILNLLSNLESKKQLIIIDTCGSAGAIIEGRDGVTLSAENRIVLTSTSSEIESSIFSGHLTDWCRAVLIWGMENADYNGDGKVSIEEVGSVKGLISDGYEGEFIL